MHQQILNQMLGLYDEYVSVRRWEAFGSLESAGAFAIKSYIENTAHELCIHKKLRIDARYFLLLTLHEMIWLPTRVSPLGERLNRELLLALKDDIQKLLKHAKVVANGGDITGEIALLSCHSLWPELKAVELAGCES
jgi:hypothetical protein